jgi:fermentation-respiration switch protein FrsA (DUF1100 family)
METKEGFAMSHTRPDYSMLDKHEVLMLLFYPRNEEFRPDRKDARTDLLIPVGDGAVIGSTFHSAGTTKPTILFFHGNGEIVADYDDLAPIYTSLGINFFAVDYRGYGRSTGSPSVGAMMEDCHAILDFADTWLKNNGVSSPLVVMGRSLGSASALELASNYRDRIDGIIIESGFAYLVPLLELMGINARRLGISEDMGCRNLEKIGTFDGPVLIIHAEYDHIIPFSDGQALFDASISSDKKLIRIDGANHNDIMFRGFRTYMQEIHDFMEKFA